MTRCKPTSHSLNQLRCFFVCTISVQFWDNRYNRHLVQNGKNESLTNTLGFLQSQFQLLVKMRIEFAAKLGQPPTTGFSGNGAIFATNSDRALSTILPRLKGRFNDVLEVPIGVLDATKQQSFGFQLVAANASPAPVGYPDEEVVAEKSFKDDVRRMVVRLVQTSH